MNIEVSKMIIREAGKKDAGKLANLIRKIDETSKYMLWEAGERKLTIEGQLKMIENLKKKPNSRVFVAEEASALVGYLFAIGGQARRNKHAAYIVIGVSKKHRGMGIGTELFQALDEWALNHNIHRLELTVVTENKAGLKLYQKSGFEIEGTKRNALYIDGKLVDEYYMSKLIGNIL